MTPDDPRHGSDRGHAAHMRDGSKPCEPCVRAHSRMNKLRRLYPDRYRKVPSRGARRRVQALQALGYGRDRIAAEIGYGNGGSLAYIMSPKSQTVTQAVDQKIREVYDRLCMVRPIGAGADRARTWAKRHGYAPPLAWDDIDNDPEPATVTELRPAHDDIDEAVVLRLLAGERMSATKPERDEAMRRWLRRGGSEAEFCRMHGWKDGRYGREVAA